MLTNAEIARLTQTSRQTVARWKRGVLVGTPGYERTVFLPHRAGVVGLLTFLSDAREHQSLAHMHDHPLLNAARRFTAEKAAKKRADNWYRRSA